MDTMFSRHMLTASRLAELLVTPLAQREDILARWFHDDQRDVKRLNYYRPTHQLVVDLHNRHRIEDLRCRVDGWREEAQADARARERLTHNVRAATQYLDMNCEREMVLLDRKRLEPIVADIRLVVHSHLVALCGAIPTRLWVDCSEDLHEQVLQEKCNVTLWAAHLMNQQCGQVEVVHSAKNRIVARGVLRRNFEADALAAFAALDRTWRRLSTSITVAPSAN